MWGARLFGGADLKQDHASLHLTVEIPFKHASHSRPYEWFRELQLMRKFFPELELREGFDYLYYTDQVGINFLSFQEALSHYLREGHINRLQPHPLFSATYYLDQSPDLIQSGVNPLLHYLEFGAKEGRTPNPLYDPVHVGRQLTASASIPDIFSFVRNPEYRTLDPHPFFSTRVYSKGVLRDSRNHALLDYIKEGRKIGKQPHLLFWPDWYSQTYRDIGDQDPFTHFLLFGHRELRNPSPLFDSRWYAARYTDVDTDEISPFYHYVTVGSRQGRQPNALFSPDFYISQVDHLNAFIPDAYLDYLARSAPLMDPHPLFKAKWYEQTYPDTLNHSESQLAHFLAHGIMEGRSCNPYGKFVPAIRAATLNALDRSVWVGEACYQYDERCDFLVLERAVHQLLDFDVEMLVVKSELESGIKFVTPEFQGSFLTDGMRLLGNLYPFGDICICLAPINQCAFYNVLRGVGAYWTSCALNANAEMNALYVLGLDPNDYMLPPSFSEIVQGSEFGEYQLNERDHYKSEITKSLLTSLAFERVFINVDDLSIELLHRYGSQFGTFTSIVLVATALSEIDRTGAALIELLDRLPRRFPVVCIAGTPLAKALSNRAAIVKGLQPLLIQPTSANNPFNPRPAKSQRTS